MTVERAKRLLEQAGFRVTVVHGFGAKVNPPGVDRWRVDRGPAGMSSGTTDEGLCAHAERFLPAVEQMTLGDA